MFLALKELNRSKFRFTMIAVIAVLIAWLVFILSGLANGLSYLGAGTLKNMDAHYMVFEEGARASMRRSSLSVELVSELEKEEYVLAVAPIGNIMSRAYAPDGSGERIDIAFHGIYPGSFLEPIVMQGRQLDESNTFEALVDITLADEGFQIGDTLEIDEFSGELTIVGFVQNQTYGYSPSVFSDLEAWRDAHPFYEEISAISLQGENIDPEYLNERFSGIEVVSLNEAVRGVPGYAEQSLTFSMMLGFLLVISAFVLAAFFYVLTLQKTNQFGVLKAMGASNTFLGKAIVSQVFLISLTSILIGIVLAYVSTLFFPAGMPFAWNISIVAGYSIALLVISIGSSLLSVRQITKIDPLQAIGRIE